MVAINTLLDDAKSGNSKLDEIKLFISPSDARNRFIYEQCHNYVSYKNIETAVKSHADWEPLTGPSSVKAAANRYASKYELPPIPKRQHGRRPK